MGEFDAQKTAKKLEKGATPEHKSVASSACNPSKSASSLLRDPETVAKKIKKPVVPMHRTMDGALNGYSLIKSAFDIQHCESQSVALDSMHDWMLTPLGFATTIGTSLLFTGFAYGAAQDEIQGQKSKIGYLWGYIREVLQAGRNGFKSVRTAVLTAALFATYNLNHLILPWSLGLGGVYLTTRVYMKWVNENKKRMLQTNQDIFQELMHYGTFIVCNATLSSIEEKSENFKSCHVGIGSPPQHFVLYDAEGKLLKNKDKTTQFIKNRYVLYKNKRGDELLYYADIHGEVELVEGANVGAIKHIIEKTGVHHLSLLQLDEFLPKEFVKKHVDALIKNQLQDKKIQELPLFNQYLYYFIRGFNGLIDGVYLYLGIIIAAVLAPQLLLVVTAISTIYCLLCVASRVYEEYQSQQELVISKYRANLAATARNLELCLVKLHECRISIESEKNPEKRVVLELQEKALDGQIEQYLKNFETGRRILRNSCYLSKGETFLIGVKHSLPIYGALLSCFFTFVFIGSISGFAIPGVVIVPLVIFGLWILEIGILHAFSKRIVPSPNAALDDKQNAAKLSKMVQDVKSSFKLTYNDAFEEHDAFIKRTYVKQAFLDWIVNGLQVDPLADEYYADYAEIARSFWAGILKGRKAVEMLLNRLQERNEGGHYQDTMWMNLLIIPAACFYALVFAANAFVKGLLRKEDKKHDFKHQEVDVAALQKIPLRANKSQEPSHGKSGMGVLVSKNSSMRPEKIAPISSQSTLNLNTPTCGDNQSAVTHSIDMAKMNADGDTISIGTGQQVSKSQKKLVMAGSLHAFAFFKRRPSFEIVATIEDKNGLADSHDQRTIVNPEVGVPAAQAALSVDVTQNIALQPELPPRPSSAPVDHSASSEMLVEMSDKKESLPQAACVNATQMEAAQLKLPPSSPASVNHSFSSEILAEMNHSKADSVSQALYMKTAKLRAPRSQPLIRSPSPATQMPTEKTNRTNKTNKTNKEKTTPLADPLAHPGEYLKSCLL